MSDEGGPTEAAEFHTSRGSASTPAIDGPARRTPAGAERDGEGRDERGADDEHDRAAARGDVGDGRASGHVGDELQGAHRGLRRETRAACPSGLGHDAARGGHEPEQQRGRHGRAPPPRSASRVTPGTSWKWNSRMGVTPSCAASVVPAAAATGAGITRANRSPSGAAIATMPAVAVTESWNPIERTSTGCTMSSTSTAPESTTAVERARPSSRPTRVSADIVPARITEGSAPVSTTMNATVAMPIATCTDRGTPSIVTSASTGPSTIATFPPETTSRCVSPVALKSRSTPGSRWESSPSARPMQQPGLARREHRLDRAPDRWRARPASRARTGSATAPMRATSDARRVTATPFECKASRKSGSSGTCSEPATRTRSPRATRGGCSSPEIHTVSRRVLAAPSARRTTRTSASACHPSAPGADPRAASPRPRPDRARGAASGDARQPHLGEHRPRRAERGDAGAARAGSRRRPTRRACARARVDPRHGGRRGRARRGDEAGDAGRGGGPRARRSPPRRARRAPARPAPRRAATGPGRSRAAGRATTRRSPPAASQRGHTVTWSRISSRVAGPMPLTFSRSSTEANGPFSVR